MFGSKLKSNRGQVAHYNNNNIRLVESDKVNDSLKEMKSALNSLRETVELMSEVVKQMNAQKVRKVLL